MFPSIEPIDCRCAVCQERRPPDPRLLNRVTADLVSRTWTTIRDRPGAAASRPAQVMNDLEAFQADPCASSWYGFIVRLGLLVQPWEVLALLGDLDPFPSVTAFALAEARQSREFAIAREVG